MGSGPDPWRIEVYRNKLRHSLGARFVLRFHAFLILSAAVAAGWLFDRLLLKVLHVATMIVRYPLAIVAAYGVFLAGVAAWLRYSGIRQYLDARGVEALAGDRVVVPPAGSADSAGDWIGGLGQAPVDAEGCLWVIGLVVVFFALGGYTIAAAPTLFADVVLELILAAGLLRGLRRAERNGWIRGVWANTWPSLVFSLFVALMLGLFALGQVPPSTTLHELWVAMRHPGR